MHKTLVIIRTYPADEYIAMLCRESFEKVVEADYIFFGEPGEYKYIKPFIRPYCCNFGGRDNVRACIEGLKKIDTSGYDYVIFCDSDITVHKNVFEFAHYYFSIATGVVTQGVLKYTAHFDFGGIKDVSNDRHYSGQMLIFSREVFHYVVNYNNYDELFASFIYEGLAIADDTIFSFLALSQTTKTKDFYGLNYWTHKKLHHMESIDLRSANEWQWRDNNRLVFPWYVKPFLDVLASMDLSGKDVFEYGGGASTLWWASKANSVTSVDANQMYVDAVNNEIKHRGFTNAKILYAHHPEVYINDVNYGWYDIIVIDGHYRDECIQPSLKRLKPNGILIFDNWQQPSVHMAHPQLVEILEKMEHKIYRQEDHPDWQTAIFYKS